MLQKPKEIFWRSWRCKYLKKVQKNWKKKLNCKTRKKKSNLQIVVQQGSLWYRSKEPTFEDRLVEVFVPQPGLHQPRLPQPGPLWIRSSNLVPLKKLQYSHNNSWKLFFGIFFFRIVMHILCMLVWTKNNHHGIWFEFFVSTRMKPV